MCTASSSAGTGARIDPQMRGTPQPDGTAAAADGESRFLLRCIALRRLLAPDPDLGLSPTAAPFEEANLAMLTCCGESIYIPIMWVVPYPYPPTAPITMCTVRCFAARRCRWEGVTISTITQTWGWGERVTSTISLSIQWALGACPWQCHSTSTRWEDPVDITTLAQVPLVPWPGGHTGVVWACMGLGVTSLCNQWEGMQCMGMGSSKDTNPMMRCIALHSMCLFLLAPYDLSTAAPHSHC